MWAKTAGYPTVCAIVCAAFEIGFVVRESIIRLGRIAQHHLLVSDRDKVHFMLDVRFIFPIFVFVQLYLGHLLAGLG